MTPLRDCKLYDVNLEGRNVGIFQIRYETRLYDGAGNARGTLPANSFLATENGTSGENNSNLMNICYCGSPGQEAQRFDGFVDTCFNRNANFYACAIVGA